jgi:hypothetical protein
MGGGGGKGGSQDQSVKIPKFVEDVAQRNLARAEAAQKIDYTPYQGPEIAAFNPMQMQAMQSQADTAAAFGMAPAGMNAMQGMPQTQTFAGGVQGYSSVPLYEQALAEAARLDPASYKQREQLFVS